VEEPSAALFGCRVFKPCDGDISHTEVICAV
jgi:hypothetical protein